MSGLNVESNFMSRVLVLVTILFFAASVNSKGVGNDVALQATTYADGVLFESGNAGLEYTLKVSGPANVTIERQTKFSEPSFISIRNEEEGPLPDGLYKYEARVIPAFTISREESSKLRDRNVLNGKTEPKLSPVSGNFRIVNGVVLDPDLEEFDAGHAEGME